MRNYLVIILILYGLPALAQIEVSGRVLDGRTSEPVAFAHIFIKGTEEGAITDKKGRFRLEVNALPKVLVISEVAHKTRFFYLRDSVTTIYIEPFSIELEDVNISEKGEPYFNMANHVLDFEFYDDLILLLGNSGREVRLIDHRGEVVERSLTPGKFTGLFKDCLDNLHLLNRDSAYQVFYDYEKIRFIHPHPREIFDQYLRNCECRFQDGLIYSIGRKRGLVTTFMYASGGATMPFYEIGDTAALEYLETNYDMEYFLAERDQGNLQYSMPVGELEENLEELQEDMDLDWMDSRIIHPSAYYIFPDGNQLRVFSLGIMTEFRFSQLSAEPVRSLIPIREDHLDFFGMDETTNKIYAVYRNSMGKVWAVDLQEPDSKLEVNEYSFIGNVQVRNGYLFFINDPGMNGSNFLFRKNLKFGETRVQDW